jgi:lipoate-protein ligase A
LTWRLIKTDQNNAAMNMAIDEAMLLTQKASFQPTLRFYDWLYPAFSFGYFQQISEEVDVSACDAHGIELVRRMTGGGTVVHGWDVTYTIIVPHGCGGLSKDISAAYCAISNCLINGLQRLGIDVAHQIEKPLAGNAPNICLTNPAQYDTLLNGKKIAGVSQRRNQSGVMYQGYIALDLPTSDVLAIASKQVGFDRVAAGQSTAINQCRSAPIYRKQLEDAVTLGFGKTLSVQFVDTELLPQEIETAELLAQTKYGSAEWNFRR